MIKTKVDIASLADNVARVRANQARREVERAAKEEIESTGQGQRIRNTRSMVLDRAAAEAGGEFL